MVTNRDLKLSKNLDSKISEFMIPFEKLITIEVEILERIPSSQEIENLMTKNRIEKIPIINSKKEILGLATLRDIQRLHDRPLANLDKKGQLYVGAAVGAKDYERAAALV